MNVNPLLMTLQQTLQTPVYPIAADEDDQQDDYIVFEYLDEHVLIYGDDTDVCEVTNIRVHWYSRLDPQPLKRRLRRALRALGGTICDTWEDHDRDTHLNHISVDVDFFSEVLDDILETEE